MIKLLKETRKKLLIKNKFSKYLLYATGEIFLVVVGILIALHINNLNETNKNAHLELQVLKGIKQDLLTNSENLIDLIEMDSLLVEGNKHLLSIIRNTNSVYDPGLDTLFGSINRYSIFFPQRLAYESLKEIGFDVVKNEALKSEIINLYDYTYTSYSVVAMELKRGLYESTNLIFLKHLDTGEDVNIKRPFDFNKLKKDRVFVNYLAHLTAEQKNLLYFTKEHLINTLDVIAEIEDEIEKLE
ncbi:MAG: hypothetical protein JXQ93_03910 [Flavobacteriaceae bacterium]